MTDDTTCTTDAQIAAAFGEFVSIIAAVTGLPECQVIQAAHAQIVAMMVTRIGGPLTANLCAGTADRVRDMPPREALPLAFATPAGSA